MGMSQRIDRVLDDLVKSGAAPGVVAMVVKDHGPLDSGAAGTKGADSSEPMTVDTIFWYASMTKALVAAGAMQLVEQGRLKLDDPASNVLPELASVQVLDGFDAEVMHLVRDPRQFDVMVMANVFGDILSDAAAMLTGSIGMLPSASLGENKKGLYEPVHGRAPDIAGKNVANPLAAILSAAMMLRHSFEMEEHAKRIDSAVRKVFAEGYRTPDIMQEGGKKVGTDAMGEAVLKAVRANA
jgi:hypothetical protein